MRRPLIGLAAAALLCAAGFFSWPVTRQVQAACGSVQARSGWNVSVERARWRPFVGLTMWELRLVSPSGGRLQVERVHVEPVLGQLVRGRLTSRCRLRGLRIDPASWWIGDPLLREIFTAGPAAESAEAILRFQSDTLTLQALVLDGRWLRARANGWLRKDREASLDLQGSVARRLLEELRFMKAEEMMTGPEYWESFRLRVHGNLRHPQFSFSSRFFSIGAERRP